ncbi:MAG: elongation factor P hydroxylase [Halioglobus sp.]|nr:elongation factor P hydroxylase [Halioglobus sp.]
MEAAAHIGIENDPVFRAGRLEQVFNNCFADRFNTRLCGGADEPLYQPAAVAGAPHILYYRLDYFASALHEVSHWCIAGARRRCQVDFGYWYAPEGRTIQQQLAFEAVECKPQALEWYFSKACGYRFQVSTDNLALAGEGTHDAAAFLRAVQQQALQWQQQGLPTRAGIYYRALCSAFGTHIPEQQLRFTLAELQR